MNDPQNIGNNQKHLGRFTSFFTAWTVAGLGTILLSNILLIHSQQQSKLAKQAKRVVAKELKTDISPKIQLQSLSLLKVPEQKVQPFPIKAKLNLVDTILPKPKPQPKEQGKLFQLQSQTLKDKPPASNLSFNYRTRAKMQAIQNKQDPSEIINKLTKLQQERLQQESETKR